MAFFHITGASFRIKDARNSVLKCNNVKDCKKIKEVSLTCQNLAGLGKICIQEPILSCQSDESCPNGSKCIDGIFEDDISICVPLSNDLEKMSYNNLKIFRLLDFLPKNLSR